MIEFGLAAYLKTKSAVTNRVSERIYNARRPQKSKVKGPAITINRMSVNRFYPLQQEADAAAPIIRIDIWAKGANAEQEVFRVFEDIRSVISSYRGMMGKQECLGCTILNESQDADASSDGSDDWDFTYGMDVRITYRQATVVLSPAPPLFKRRFLRLSTGRLFRLSTGRIYSFDSEVS